MRRILPFLLLLLSFTAHAQVPFPPVFDPGDGFFGRCRFETPSDSSDYRRFRDSMLFDLPEAKEQGPWPIYRLLWQESQHGHSWLVMRGDSSILAEEEARPTIGAYEWTRRFGTVDGKRGIVRFYDRPCAMICQSVRYYVEE